MTAVVELCVVSVCVVSLLTGCVLGQVCVPFNLVKRSPRGEHTFTLMNTHQVIGSLTTEVMRVRMHTNKSVQHWTV